MVRLECHPGESLVQYLARALSFARARQTALTLEYNGRTIVITPEMTTIQVAAAWTGE